MLHKQFIFIIIVNQPECNVNISFKTGKTFTWSEISASSLQFSMEAHLRQENKNEDKLLGLKTLMIKQNDGFLCQNYNIWIKK